MTEKPERQSHKDYWCAADFNAQFEKDVKAGTISNENGKRIMDLCEKMSHRPNFRGYLYREEMVLAAVENVLRYYFKYDSSKGAAFSYYSRIAWNAFLRYIAYEKRQFEIKLASVDKAHAIMRDEGHPVGKLTPTEREYDAWRMKFLHDQEAKRERDKEKEAERQWKISQGLLKEEVPKPPRTKRYHDKTCAWEECGKAFRTISGQKKYCSVECRKQRSLARRKDDYREKAADKPSTFGTRECGLESCDVVFTRLRKKHKFCSYKCCKKHHSLARRKDKKKRIDVICEADNCDNVLPNKVGAPRIQLYCSPKCKARMKYLRKKQRRKQALPTVKCEHELCNRTFKQTRKNRRFCCKSCSTNQWIRENPEKCKEHRRRWYQKSGREKYLNKKHTTDWSPYNFYFPKNNEQTV